MILGIPVLEKDAQTLKCLEFVLDSSSAKTHVVVINNGLSLSEDIWRLPVTILQMEKNVGYYYPLLELYKHFEDPYLCIMHNDVFVYESGWDLRLIEAFQENPLLYLVGFCGSNEVDNAGGRGLGTMCNFRGERGQLQVHTGTRVFDLRPAAVLDSLFMGFRREAVPRLNITHDVPLAHFMDRIWPMMLIEHGYNVGILGVEIDHVGGTTICGPAYEASAREWCAEQGLLINTTGDLTMYLEAERRWLSEYRDDKKLIPGRVSSDWTFRSDRPR